MLVPALTYAPLSAIGGQRPGGAQGLSGPSAACAGRGHEWGRTLALTDYVPPRTQLQRLPV
jgi:hypothetical protein